MIVYGEILIWFIPVIAALLAPIVAHLSRKLTHVISIVAMGASLIIALSMLLDLLKGKIICFPGNRLLGRIPYEFTVTWIPLKDLIGVDIRFGVLFDPLSIFMASIVTFVSFWIFIFSVGYMDKEPDIGRYWFLMNIFVSSMLLLVLSSNLLQMFIAWEIVGLCSWALISFWYKSKAPSPDPRFKTEGEYNAHCGLKALLTTSFADAFFLVAIALVGYVTALSMGEPTFDFLKLSEDLSWINELIRLGILPIFSIMLLSGPLGKSAQFPYQEWLPEAMAGPTTVSALIHAATMVKAGAYSVGRFYVIIYEGVFTYHQTLPAGIELFFITAAYVGAFTAFLAGTQGMVAKELKKILAYSTISQLGYIFAAFGIAGALLYQEAFLAGALHILSHAVFKALLFLCAGAILHTVHSKYVYDMGGLKKYMPVTYYTMLIGALSLSGVPPFAGFFSKDAIIHSTLHNPELLVIFIILVVTAAITVFYSFRMIGLVFFGDESDHVKSLLRDHKLHDAPLVMQISLLALAITTLVAGFFFEPIMEVLEGGKLDMGDFIWKSLDYIYHTFASELVLLSLVIILIGFIPAYYVFIARKADPEKIVENNVLLRALYRFLINRWYFNAAYYKIVDCVRVFSNKLRKMQTGIANVNIAYMVIAFLVALILLIIL